MSAESVTWVQVADGLPDADLTVNITLAEGSGEPVWLGYFDGEQWRDVEGAVVDVIAWAPMLKGYIVTVELRGPTEVVKREWPTNLVENAEDAYLMTHSHLSDAQKDRVIGHNIVEVAS